MAHPRLEPGFGAYPAHLHGFFNGWCEGSRYQVHEVIGSGSYGVVCAALDTQTGDKVAIKMIPNVFANVADATRILREIKLLRLLKHPDVVDLKHILLPSDPRHFKDIYLVFELLETDLHTVIGANADLLMAVSHIVCTIRAPKHFRCYLQWLRSQHIFRELTYLSSALSRLHSQLLLRVPAPVTVPFPTPALPLLPHLQR